MPQARLPEYNPLVMSKLFLLRDAARLNPWGVRFHLWVDAGHLCATEQNPTPAGTSMYRKHMASGMFVTHWPYGTTTEVRSCGGSEKTAGAAAGGTHRGYNVLRFSSHSTPPSSERVPPHRCTA